jgi:hypothetical protein
MFLKDNKVEVKSIADVLSEDDNKKDILLKDSGYSYFDDTTNDVDNDTISLDTLSEFSKDDFLDQSYNLDLDKNKNLKLDDELGMLEDLKLNDESLAQIAGNSTDDIDLISNNFQDEIENQTDSNELEESILKDITSDDASFDSSTKLNELEQSMLLDSFQTIDMNKTQKSSPDVSIDDENKTSTPADIDDLNCTTNIDDSLMTNSNITIKELLNAVKCSGASSVSISISFKD